MSAEPPAARRRRSASSASACAVALVVGNIIGSGVYLLPASLAPYGRNSLSAWLFTAAGAIVLAVVFAALPARCPRQGGPYAYTRTAFGQLAGFVVAWGYWVAIWVGNAAIATGAVSYTSVVAPWIASVPGASALATLAVVWLLTLVNCFGVRAAGWVQVVTTVLKLVPLVAIGPLGLFFVRGDLVDRSTRPFPLSARRHRRRGGAHALGAARSRVGDRAGGQGARPGAHDPARDARRHARERRDRARCRAAS